MHGLLLHMQKSKIIEFAQQQTRVAQAHACETVPNHFKSSYHKRYINTWNKSILNNMKFNVLWYQLLHDQKHWYIDYASRAMHDDRIISSLLCTWWIFNPSLLIYYESIKFKSRVGGMPSKGNVRFGHPFSHSITVCDRTWAGNWDPSMTNFFFLDFLYSLSFSIYFSKVSSFKKFTPLLSHNATISSFLHTHFKLNRLSSKTPARNLQP